MDGNNCFYKTSFFVFTAIETCKFGIIDIIEVKIYYFVNNDHKVFRRNE